MALAPFLSGIVSRIRDEVVATLPGLPVVGVVRWARGRLAIGDTPNDTLYELGSGGQAVLQPVAVQIAQVGTDETLLKLVSVNDTNKPVSIEIGKLRGDGVPGSPNFSKASLIGDRILNVAFFGSRAPGVTGTSACHAGYLFIECEETNTGQNELATWMMLRPGAKVGFQGNGLEMNAVDQAGFAGPNRPQFGSQQDHKAILILGPGGDSVAPLRFTPGELRPDNQTEDGLVEGAVEFDLTGMFHLTIGLDGALKRRAIETNQVSAAITPSGAASGGSTVTASVLGSGMGCAKVLLTVSGADYTTVGGAIASLEFATAFAAVPVVVGSRDAHNGTSADGGHEFAFNGRANNRISISLMSGTLLNGQTYCFNLLWKIP